MRQQDREAKSGAKGDEKSPGKEEVERPASRLLAQDLLTNEAQEYSDAHMTLSPKQKDQKKPSKAGALPARVSKGGKSIIESDETFDEIKPKNKNTPAKTDVKS